MACIDNALKDHPERIELLNNKANLLKSMGRLQEALEIYNVALNIQPLNPSILANRGLLLQSLHRIDESNQDLASALTLAGDDDTALRAILSSVFPVNDPVWQWLGEAPLSINNPSPTLSACLIFAQTLLLDRPAGTDPLPRYLEALQHEPRLIGARLHLAEELLQRGVPTEASRILEQLVKENPEDLHCIFYLASTQAELRDIGRTIELLKAISHTDSDVARSNLLFFLNYDPQATASTMRSEAESMGEWLLKQAGQTPGMVPPRFFRERQIQEPLRVGFVGGDFCLHPAGLMLSSILSAIDSKRITPFLYSTSPDKADWLNRRFKLLAAEKGGMFTHLSDLSAEMRSQKIQSDQIDILIDLAGHTRHTGLVAFAYRPALCRSAGWGTSPPLACPPSTSQSSTPGWQRAVSKRSSVSGSCR